MIAALAGRRIDAPSAPAPRFPLSSVDRVRERLRTLFRAERPAGLVSSAACGADLVALAEATSLEIPCRIVLPFDPERFRADSVTNRPGEWGALFDRLLRQARSGGGVVVVEHGLPTDGQAFAAVNRRILDEAATLAAGVHDVVGILVWEGSARAGDDLTADFGSVAAARGHRVVHVSTL